jgi:hypothetical protein
MDAVPKVLQGVEQAGMISISVIPNYLLRLCASAPLRETLIFLSS